LELETSESPFAGFPEEIQYDVEGLTFLGYLQEEIDWCGHTFTLRTLTTADELQAAQISKEYLDSFGQLLAYAAAHVALSLISVDGKEDFVVALGPSDKSYARQRFNFVTEWYRPTIEHLFEQYERLKGRQEAAIKAVQDLSSGSRTHFWPSPASFTTQADFPSPIEDITELLTD
jgi:hypothetical protein